MCQFWDNQLIYWAVYWLLPSRVPHPPHAALPSLPWPSPGLLLQAHRLNLKRLPTVSASKLRLRQRRRGWRWDDTGLQSNGHLTDCCQQWGITRAHWQVHYRILGYELECIHLRNYGLISTFDVILIWNDMSIVLLCIHEMFLFYVCVCAVTNSAFLLMIH